MSRRTPTPDIDRIWTTTWTTHLWHMQWLNHLHTQTRANPNHPGHDHLDHYHQAAQQYTDNPTPWLIEQQHQEQITRHDLQAALDIYNRHAGHETAHYGLTSHDITDPTTQIQIRDSANHILQQITELAHQLGQQARTWRLQPLLARTHGQPAQVTSYGHRIATTITPLLAAGARLEAAIQNYDFRPPHGAVGTSADLNRVLHGWRDRWTGTHTCAEKRGAIVIGPGDVARCGCGNAPTTASEGSPSASESPAGISGPPEAPEAAGKASEAVDLYGVLIAKAAGFQFVMPTTRQIYHRSYDLPIASAMVEVAAVAQTWATDRRLEAMLGLGNEARDPGQVGSSAMAHKTNPVLCERICSLASVTRSHYTGLAEIAGQGWLEGDVSTSAARRLLLPQLFSNVSAILINWRDAADRWEPDCKRLSGELELHNQEVSTGALLHYLVESGVPRSEAHERLRGGVLGLLADADGEEHDRLLAVMVEASRIPAMALIEVDVVAEATASLGPSS